MTSYRLQDQEFQNLNQLGGYLHERLRLEGEAVALKWSMEPPTGVTPYTGGLKLAHCQFMQRARFLGETYCLTAENNYTGCSGYSYIGLDDPPASLETGELQAAGKSGPGLFATPAASRRALQYYYRLDPHTVRYFTCAPLSRCTFEPDVVVLVADARRSIYAVRAAMYHHGGVVEGVTGPGTCASSWTAAYKTGEIRFTLGCHGVFEIMGLAPDELCVSFPFHWLLQSANTLREWEKIGRKTFHEPAPNREREWMRLAQDDQYEYKKS